jgi:hypothetical protein
MSTHLLEVRLSWGAACKNALEEEHDEWDSSRVLLSCGGKGSGENAG